MACPWNAFTRPLGAIAISGALLLGAGTALARESTPAADQIDLTSAPVDMHEGTCANPTLDPWDEIGRLQRQRFADAPALDDEVVDDDVDLDVDTGLLTEDLDDDGILDDGEDLNENDVLDVGIDVDDDGILDEEEIVAEGEVAIAVINLPTVWTTNGVIDAPFEPIFNQPNVIAVHQSSDQYETIVACGNVGGIVPDDDDGIFEETDVVVGLSAMNDSGLRGYAVFTYDTIIFGEDQTVVDVYLFEGLPTQRDAMMAATPTP
jgi:hypothetical protein